MRYAIFSDVHANRQAWGAVRADIERMQVDTLVCLGDVVGYGPMPQEVLTAVRQATPNFVLGNHDAAACGRLDPSIFNPRARSVIEWTSGQLDDDSLAFLRTTPLQMDGTGIQFCHAEMMEPGEFGYIDGLEAAELNLQAMTQPLGFIGHTHLPLAFTMPRKGGAVTQLPPMDFEVERGRRYIVNVGSVGEPRTTDVRASYVIYDDVERRILFRKVIFDVEAYKADLQAVGLEIMPYFVQVVDAGKVAGQPVPAAAPQLALAQLPKVAEVVAGAHGRLVVGSPGAAWGSTGMVQTVRPPKAMPGWVIVLMVVLAMVVVGAVAMVVSRKDDEMAGDPSASPASAGPREESSIGAPRREGDPAAARVSSEAAAAVEGGPIKQLQVRVFAQKFENLAKLREIEKDDRETPAEEVADGLFSLDHGVGMAAFGLVWEGNLVVPETGEYEFTLDSDDGSALLLYWESVLELDRKAALGNGKTTKVRLRRGHAPIRLEYIHEGEEEGLVVRWSGPGLDGVQSLLRPATGQRPPAIARTPDRTPPAGEPARAAVKHEAPAKLAKDLLAYWSFDRPGSGGSRFEQQGDGSVTENFVAENGQRVEVLVPDRDIGTDWLDPGFDAKGWQDGLNGVGYEETPGDYQQFLKTVVKGEARKHPHSLYVRIPFQIADPDAYTGLALYMRCDDGFVAYLNGSQIASKNLLDPPVRWNSAASAAAKDNEAVVPELFKVNRSLKYLKAGGNVLAIQGLNHGGNPNATNSGSTSTDLLVQARLVALRKDNTLPADAGSNQPSPHDLAVGVDTLQGKVKASAGKFGDAYELEEGSIEIGAKEKYEIGTGSFSLSLWFTRNPNSTDNEARRLLSAGGGSETKAGWALWISKKGDALTFVVGDGTSRAEITADDASLTSGDWRHVVATVDRDNGMVFLFLDGQLVADQRVPLLKDASIGSNSGLSIGRNSDDQQHHRGKLDDLALWRRVLVPEEVEKIYKSGKGLGAVFQEQGE